MSIPRVGCVIEVGVAVGVGVGVAVDVVEGGFMMLHATAMSCECPQLLTFPMPA